MIRQRLMETGSWDLTLDPYTPRFLVDQVDVFDHLLVLPAWIPPSSVSDTVAQSLSVYTAPLIGWSPGKTSFYGFGPAYWLGTNNGLSDLYEAAFSPTKSFDDWLTDSTASVLRVGGDAANGITAGSIDAGVGTAQIAVDAGASPLDLLNLACAQFGFEWRINADMTLDADDEATLFDTLNFIVVPDGGRDILAGCWLAELTLAVDAEDYTTRVVVEAADASTGSADISPATPYDDIDGNAIQRERYYVVTAAPSTPGATTAAANRLALYDHLHEEIGVSIPDLYCGLSLVEPGDSIYVYDADNGLVDTATKYQARGETMFPETVRVVAVDQPIQRGMGVFIRTGSGTYLDFTDWVVFEDGATRLEVGASPRIANVLGSQQ